MILTVNMCDWISMQLGIDEDLVKTWISRQEWK